MTMTVVVMMRVERGQAGGMGKRCTAAAIGQVRVRARERAARDPSSHPWRRPASRALSA